MESAHAHRKDEHLSVAELEMRQRPYDSSLNGVRLLHNALPESRVTDVDLHVADENFPFATPFYIEAMTGGSQKTGRINAKLAEVAKETGLAMAVGSQSVALKDTEAIATFTIAREINPDGFILANIGAGHPAQHAQTVIDMIGANALEVHVNAAQEIIMAEGDREFMWLDNLADIVAKVSVPVIVKEVGFGMRKETITTLHDIGVQYVNVGGRSGTNFARIEDRRNRTDDNQHAYLYDWGQTTAESLLEAKTLTNKPTIFATGGIQTPLDVVKAQVLGAKAVGVAGHFLHTIMNEDTAGLITEVTRWQNHLAKIYALLGVRSQVELLQVPYLLDNELLNYANQRELH